MSVRPYCVAIISGEEFHIPIQWERGGRGEGGGRKNNKKSIESKS